MIIVLALIPLVIPGNARAYGDDARDLPVVASVDLARYMGKWYELARLPNKFQKDCAGEVAATYSLVGEGELKVVNECRRQNGRLDQAAGKARLADKGGPKAKLKVRFAPAWLSWLPAVWGDYWILDLAPDYSYSLVGTPDRKYLWLLSRTPQIDEAVYKRLMEKAAANGFDVSKVSQTRQSP